MCDLDNLPKVSTFVPQENVAKCDYARGYLERDLRPSSLWSKATMPPSNTTVSNDTPAGSSSNEDREKMKHFETGEPFVAGEDDFTMEEQEQFSEYFLGDPEELFKVLPSARPFSKARAYLDAERPRSPPPVPARRLVPHARSSSASSSGYVRPQSNISDVV